MKLSDALRIQPGESISFSGSGGKTTAIFTLAREFEIPVIATTTTHFSKEQVEYADQIVYSTNISNPKEFVDSIKSGVTILIGEEDSSDRVAGPALSQLYELYQYTKGKEIYLLIEADGSRQRALKAPAAHEPVIPKFVDQAVVLAGLSALGKPLSSKFVHRADEFKKLSGLKDSEEITQEAVCRVLLSDTGGLKGIPENARRICLLNQADDEIRQAQGKRIASSLISTYDSIVLASLGSNWMINQEKSTSDQYHVFGVFEPICGIVLAAGGSERLGRPKQLLSWKGTSLVDHVVSTVVKAGLSHTVVVVGAFDDQVSVEVEKHPVDIVVNPNWKAGQSSSIKAGISAVPDNAGSVIFFLVDQPNLSPRLIHALIECHSATLNPIIAPMIAGQRGNPVLFDRRTFGDFDAIHGDSGGRQLFSNYPVTWMNWHDEAVLLDIDTEEDYLRLLANFE